MTHRQLARQSGVSHSTISRILSGERVPSLGTADKLFTALQGHGGGSETANAFGMSSAPRNPMAEVEYALRSDELLLETEVRQVMQYYLARRVGRPE